MTILPVDFSNTSTATEQEKPHSWLLKGIFLPIKICGGSFEGLKHLKKYLRVCPWQN
jgi:hypothetical protein